MNNAIASMLEARKRGHGRGGVFWQTQGSGKSFSMVFFAQKVLRKVAGNWTFVVVTDRVELDDQIAKTFKATGAVSETEADKHRLGRLADAVDALIWPDLIRREFFGYERLVGVLYGAVMPDPAALEFASRVASLAAIAEASRGKLAQLSALD